MMKKFVFVFFPLMVLTWGCTGGGIPGNWSDNSINHSDLERDIKPTKDRVTGDQEISTQTDAGKPSIRIMRTCWMLGRIPMAKGLILQSMTVHNTTVIPVLEWQDVNVMTTRTVIRDFASTQTRANDAPRPATTTVPVREVTNAWGWPIPPAT